METMYLETSKSKKPNLDRLEKMRAKIFKIHFPSHTDIWVLQISEKRALFFLTWKKAFEAFETLRKERYESL